VVSSDRGLHAAGDRRTEFIRRDGRDEDHRDMFRKTPCVGQGLPCSDDGEIGCRLRVDDAAFPNPRARDDPLVGRVDHGLEIGVGQDVWRNPGTSAEYRHPAQPG
jgi:hypothetical protein